jgi:hypothetical protein
MYLLTTDISAMNFWLAPCRETDDVSFARQELKPIFSK